MGARTGSSHEEGVEEREDTEAGVDNDANDEDIQDEYEKGDFIVDDAEEEQEQASSDEEARAKKKKRDADENYEVDEDDYELLQEANVTGFHRPKSQSSKTKLKRLKKAGKVASEGVREGQMGFSDDELEEGNIRSCAAGGTVGQGDDEGGPPEDLGEDRKFGLNADRDEDDGVDEGRGGSRVGRSSKNKLEEEERYMTERDNHIRETDVPERLQLLEDLIGTIPVKEPKVEEAEWIYDQGFGYPLKKLPKEFEYLPFESLAKIEVVRQIAFVLTMLHDSKLEIPFIGMYRKEDCAKLVGSQKEEEASNLRDFKLLWQIFSMDKKWWLLQRKKEVLAEAYEKRARIEEQKNPENLDMLKKLLTALQEARSQVAVDDVDAKYTLYFPSNDLENDQKRPKKRSLYSSFCKAGLGVLARQFGLTPEQFGENLQAMYKRHEVQDSSFTPEDLAAEHSEGEITDPPSVLRGARHMAAVEISTEPVVRDYFRNVFSEKVVVSTRPTKDGNTVIDSYHDYALVKRISGKPLSAFKDGQWLIIQKAEEEKLIKVSVGLPKDVVNNVLMQEFETMYVSDGVSRTAQLWNEQRRQIIKDAVTSMLLPLLEKEARMLLNVRAKQWVGQECGAALWTKVSTAPWKVTNYVIEDDELPRVLACSFGDAMGTSPTFVMLDSAGEIVNTLHTPHIFSHENDQNDMMRLQKFMLEYQPQIAVVGAGGGLKSVHARKAILQAGIKLIEMYPLEVNTLENMHTDIVDEYLARIYEASSISKEQLPGQPGIVRRAVYLGRYLQSPLAAIAALCGPSREILSFTFHGLQNFLTDDERYSVLEQVMVTITNQVGIDVNMAAVHDWLFAPLQFISGLGARKASVMQRSIQGAGWISSRKELLTQLRLVKKMVFINACGFLRIRNNGQTTAGNQIIDPLDDTRVHPESYELARGMAEIVYWESQKLEEEEIEDEITDLALEYAKNNPRIVLTLDVEEYSRMIEDRDGIKKQETFKDIQKELVQGFREWRYPYTHPTDDEVLTLLAGENDQTV